MATTLTWKVNQMYTLDLPTNGYVVKVTYELYGEDIVSETEKYTGNYFWIEEFKIIIPLPQDYVPFDQLTKDEVLMWLWERYNPTNPQDWAVAQEFNLETQIMTAKNEKAGPTPVPNPWD